MGEASVKRSKSNLVSDRHWTVYAAAGAATAFACQAAEAEIVYVNVNQTLDATPGGASSTFLGVGAGSTGQIFLQHTATSGGGGAALFGVLASNGSFAGFQANGFPYAFNLAHGQSVATQNFEVGTGTMAFGSGYGNSQFLSAGLGLLGFTFDFGEGDIYGWVRVDMFGAPDNAFSIVDYAYCMPGQGILAGKQECVDDVPEPGTLGLLAAGGAGLLALRRRRKEIRAAA